MAAAVLTTLKHETMATEKLTRTAPEQFLAAKKVRAFCLAGARECTREEDSTSVNRCTLSWADAEPFFGLQYKVEEGSSPNAGVGVNSVLH
jgi:hypothetical protein